MGIQSGEIFVAFMLGVVFAAGLAWVVASLYRRRMVALMRGGAAGGASAASGAEPLAVPARVPPQLDGAENRRATRRLLAALTATCLLVALTQSWFALSVQFQFKGKDFSVARLLVLGAVLRVARGAGLGPDLALALAPHRGRHRPLRRAHDRARDAAFQCAAVPARRR